MGTCTAILTIRRNLNAPQFTTSSINEEVWEYEAIGFQVADPEARDADGVSGVFIVFVRHRLFKFSHWC